MFKKTLLTISVISIGLLAGCSVGSDPIAYNNDLVDLTDPAYDSYNDYSTYAQETSLTYLDKIDERRQQTLAHMQTTRNDLADYGDFDGDESLIQAFIEDFDMIIETLENEEVDLIALWQEVFDVPDEEWTDEMETQYTEDENTLIDSINEKLESSGNKLSGVQEAFAAKHDFILE